MTTENQLNGHNLPLVETPLNLFTEAAKKFAQVQIKQIQLAGGQLDIGAFMINTQIAVMVQECIINELAEKHGFDKDALLKRTAEKLHETARQMDGPKLMIPSSVRQ